MGGGNFSGFCIGGGGIACERGGKAILRGGNHVIFDLKVTFLKKNSFRGQKCYFNALLLSEPATTCAFQVHFRAKREKICEFFRALREFFCSEGKSRIKI